MEEGFLSMSSSTLGIDFSLTIFSQGLSVEEFMSLSN